MIDYGMLADVYTGLCYALTAISRNRPVTVSMDLWRVATMLLTDKYSYRYQDV